MVGGEYPSHLGVRLPRNWPLKKLFYQAYIELMNHGQVDNLKMKYSFKEEHSQPVLNSNHPIQMIDVFTSFVFFGILAIIALIILFCECGFHKKHLDASLVN